MIFHCPSECEYGDRASNCAPRFCNNPNTAQMCCHTCGEQMSSTVTDSSTSDGVASSPTKPTSLAGDGTTVQEITPSQFPTTTARSTEGTSSREYKTEVLEFPSTTPGGQGFRPSAVTQLDSRSPQTDSDITTTVVNYTTETFESSSKTESGILTTTEDQLSKVPTSTQKTTGPIGGAITLQTSYCIFFWLIFIFSFLYDRAI